MVATLKAQKRRKNMQNFYQGWTNAQTWCVAACLNNTKAHQDRALDAVRGVVTPFGQNVLQTVCHDLRGEIFGFAAWAWPEGYNYAQVDWVELENHFRQTLSEQVQP